MPQGPVLDIPIFPLNTVLFPGGFLPLRIFEPRYLDMVSACLRQQSPFGVVLITDGKEVGMPAATVKTGTLAAIVDFDKTSDQMLAIACIGGERFRMLDSRIEANRLQRASVEVLEDLEDRVLTPRHESLARFLRAVVNRPGVTTRRSPVDIDYGSAREIGYRLAEALPLGVEEQQGLLEIDDAQLRLDRISKLLDEMDFTLDA